MARLIDWNEVKQAYVEGASWIEMRSKFGVSTGAIYNHLRDEKWDDYKIEYNLKIARAINDKTSETIKDLAGFHQRTEEAVNEVNRLTHREIQRLSRLMEKDEDAKLNAQKFLNLLKLLNETLVLKHQLRFFKPPEIKPETEQPIDPSEIIALNGESPEIADLMNELRRRLDSNG